MKKGRFILYAVLILLLLSAVLSACNGEEADSPFKDNPVGGGLYHTMDGGKELAFDELYPVNIFPVDLPYMGSAFYFAHADVKGDENAAWGISEDDAMDLLAVAILDKMGHDTAIVQSGEGEVDGQQCYLFSFGDNSPEKFTAYDHYAVTGSGKIYIMGILTGEYESLAMG